MSKKTFKLNNLNIEYVKENILETFELYYKKECNAERIKELKENLSKIESHEDKIKYCKDILKEYNQSLDAITLAISGMTIAQGMFKEDTKIFFDRIIQKEIEALEEELKNEKETKKQKPEITSPAFALFAQIVNHCGIIIIDENESHEKFCERVMQHFKIKNVPAKNARQKFTRSEPDLRETDKNFKIVTKSIIPKLEDTAKEKIKKYINSKIVKLYQ